MTRVYPPSTHFNPGTILKDLLNPLTPLEFSVAYRSALAGSDATPFVVEMVGTKLGICPIDYSNECVDLLYTNVNASKW
jgi:hypothetical protein